MGKKIIKIGSRGSKLALWQAEWVQVQLEALGFEVHIQKIKTTGDKILDVPLSKVGGKGLFVKEIEEALLRFDIDLAVHSMKDVPAILPEALHISAIPLRENPLDALISRDGVGLQGLPEGACIGTSSLRRQAQLSALRPDFRFVSLRGNLDTRLRKLEEGQFDAIILASAGLRRLGWQDRITEDLSAGLMLPAIGQGALGIECRRADSAVNEILSVINHPETALVVRAERDLLFRLEGGCQVPIGGHGRLLNDQLRLEGLVASLDGKEIIRESREVPSAEAGSLGKTVADTLLAKGARRILAEVYCEDEGL